MLLYSMQICKLKKSAFFRKKRFIFKLSVFYLKKKKFINYLKHLHVLHLKFFFYSLGFQKNVEFHMKNKLKNQ